MTRLQSFPLPDVGEGLTEAEILEWKVGVGDLVEVNQIFVEIETAKAAVELPSPHAGRVHRLLAEPGITIDVGTPIIEIDTEPDAGPLPDDAPVEVVGADEEGTGADGASASGAADAAGPADGSGDGAKIGEAMADGRVQTLVGIIPAERGSRRRGRRAARGSTAGATGTDAQVTGSVGAGAPADESRAALPIEAAVAAALAEGSAAAPLATPPVRKLAKDWGIDLHDVIPSRADGVISRADVEAVRDGAGAVASDARPASSTPAFGGARVMEYDPATRERREPIKGVRKLMAQAMVESAFTAPHVTEFLSVDVTPMMELRDRLRARRDWAGVKLSPLTFAARAVCLAARNTPEVNCTWDEASGEVIFKEYVHLGIAAATPRGLVVPVIRDADQQDLRSLAGSLSDLTEVARSGKTAPADMTGGTITITNVGVLGVDTGTPIINPGESAILALGSVKDAPWVVDGQLAVRKVCQLALSFDHRVVDGEKGSQFLAEVGALMSDPALAMTY